MKININDITNEEYKKEILDTINLLTIDYPILKEDIDVIHVKYPLCGDAVASHYFLYNKKIESKINLNPDYFESPYLENILKDKTYSQCTTIKGYISHEIGHALQLYILCKKLKLDLKKYKQFKYIIFMRKLENKKLKEKYCEEFMNYHLNRFDWNKKKASQYLGTYNINNSDEFFPDCFGLYYELKDKKELNNKEMIILNFVKEVVKDFNENYLSFFIN